MTISSSNTKSLVIWFVDVCFISLEAIFAFIVYISHGGISWLAFGLDSLGELASSLANLWFLIHNRHHDEFHDHNHSTKVEQIVIRVIAIIFFVLAGLTFVIHSFVHEHLEELGFADRRIILVGFFILTSLMAVLKWRSNSGPGDPRRAEAWQSIACVISAMITFFADLSQPYLAWSQMIGAIMISSLMVYLGIRTLRYQRLCC